MNSAVRGIAAAGILVVVALGWWALSEGTTVGRPGPRRVAPPDAGESAGPAVEAAPGSGSSVPTPTPHPDPRMGRVVVESPTGRTPVDAVTPSPAGETPQEKPYLYNTANAWAKGDDVLYIRAVTCLDAAARRYKISGLYKLLSAERATLSIGCTDGRLSGETSSSIARGEEDFEFTVVIEKVGKTFVSMYPAGGGESICGQYFDH